MVLLKALLWSGAVRVGGWGPTGGQVGDAYVVAGFLPPEGDAGGGAEHAAAVRRVCLDMLEVAATMLDALRAYRQAPGGRDTRCRIGVAVGPVVAGVLGLLQPRCDSARGLGYDSDRHG